MKKFIVVLVALCAIGCSQSVAAAQASSIAECGNYAPTGWSSSQNIWRGYWTFRATTGFTPVTNLTTRSVRCTSARSFALRVSSDATRRHNGFVCRWRHVDEEYDVRCTKENQVIHWQGGD